MGSSRSGLHLRAFLKMSLRSSSTSLSPSSSRSAGVSTKSLVFQFSEQSRGFQARGCYESISRDSLLLLATTYYYLLLRPHLRAFLGNDTPELLDISLPKVVHVCWSLDALVHEDVEQTHSYT